MPNTQDTIEIRGANPSSVRNRNARLILSLIWRNGPMSKAELARMTSLSAQTVSVIMRQLEQEGILRRGKPVRGKVGQPSVPMELARDGAYFLGLKAGRRSADLILTDFSGTVLERRTKFYRYPEPGTVIGFTKDALEQVLSGMSPSKRSRVAGLGIAIPYMLWNWAEPLGVPQSAMDPWREVDLREEIARATDIPVFLENDATAACGAELTFGRNSEIRHFLYFYIGYFIGGGVVLNRSLYRGPSGNAGAIGPMPVFDGTRVVPLFEVASLSVLERQLADRGFETASMWEKPSNWAVDPAICSRWVERAARGLAQAIIASSSVIDFEHALIDGWIPTELRRQLVEATRAAMKSFNTVGIVEPTIIEGSVGYDARSLGAASLPLSQRIFETANY